MNINLMRKLTQILFNATYFTLSMASLVWLCSNYAGLTWISIPMMGLATLYVVAGIFSLLCLFRHNFLEGSSVFVISGRAQKLIRLAAIMLPLPALLFSAIFFQCVKSFDGTPAAWSRVDQIGKLELPVFGKSVIRAYLPNQDKPAATASEDVDYGPFMAVMQRAIKHHWHPPKAETSNQTKVQFKILTDGSLRQLSLVSSSGDKLFDRAALLAIEESAPFQRLPESSIPDVDIQFTFDYNIWSPSANKRFKPIGSAGYSEPRPATPDDRSPAKTDSTAQCSDEFTSGIDEFAVSYDAFSSSATNSASSDR